MTSDDPPGKVLPFARPRRVPAELDRLRTMLDDDSVTFEETDVDEGLACADAAIAQGVRGGHEAKADLLNLRACRILASGDAEAALAAFTTLIASYPSYVHAYVMRAQIHGKRGDEEAAREDLDRAVELAPTDPAGYLRRAAFYETKGDGPRALANFRRAAQLDPTSDDALHGMARRLAADGDARGATRAYAQAAQKELGDADAYKMRGFMHFVSGQDELALADYEKSVAMSPNDADALRWRGLCRLRANRCDAAIADFTRLIAMRPSDAFGFWRRGEALVRTGKPREALRDLDRAIALGDDQNGAAHFARGTALEALGDREAALLSYDVAIDRDPSNVACRLRRFQIHNEAEDWPRCQIDADALLAVAPESTVVLHAHARLCVRNDRRDDALAAYDRLIALQPGNAGAYHERARLHAGRGDTEAARADVERAFELAPDDREIRVSYGTDQHREARTDEERAAAVRLITSSVELDANNAAAWADAGRCLQRIACHHEAAAHLSRALALDPDNADYLSERARCLVNQAPPAWKDPVGYRPYIVAALADVDRAIAVAKSEDLELFSQRAGLREDLGDLEAALADHTKVIELDPDLIDGYMERARLRKLTGDMPGARLDAARVTAMEDATMEELAAFVDVSTIKRFNLDEA
jgi:tetratricopeptide (TPR) repeat protein